MYKLCVSYIRIYNIIEFLMNIKKRLRQFNINFLYIYKIYVILSLFKYKICL